MGTNNTTSSLVGNDGLTDEERATYAQAWVTTGGGRPISDTTRAAAHAYLDAKRAERRAADKGNS